MTDPPGARAATRANAHKPSTARYSASAPGPAAHPALRAVEKALSSDAIRVDLPEPVGAVRLPSPQRLAFYGGIAALGVLGIMDWPVALVIGIGHLLADEHHHKCLASFGEALAEA